MAMKCPVCGKELNDSWSDNSSMKNKGMCFSCSIWSKRLKELKTLPEHTIAIIDGTYYSIGDEDSKSAFRGFGGARFQIEFSDGYKVVTTNLWCGGDIPLYWRDKLPNNAKFEKNLKLEKIGNCSYLIEKK